MTLKRFTRIVQLFRLYVIVVMVINGRDDRARLRPDAIALTRSQKRHK